MIISKRPKRRHKISLVTIGIVAGAILALACQGGGGQGKGEGGTTLKSVHDSCITVVTQKVARVGRSRDVEAQTHSDCDPTPIKHLVFITLAYHPENSSTYVTMGTKYCEAIPVPGIPTDCHIRLSTVCHIGIWRITVLITGTGPNGTPFSFPLPRKRGGGATTHIKSCA